MNPLWLWLIPAVFIVSFLVFGRRLRRLSPHGLQRQHRGVLYYMLGVLLLAMLAGHLAGQMDPWFFLLWAPFLLTLAYSGFRSLTPREHLQSFALDTVCCGRCEYDLTGNVSGVCPECGWVIPQGPVVVKPINWPFWWQRWEIPHLENWRRSLALMIVLTAAFAGLTCLMLHRKNVFAILPALMALHFAINALRVVCYGRLHPRLPP